MKKTFSIYARQALANIWPLYGAAFAMAIGLGVLWTAMPFIIRNIGGTEEHVGLSLAASMFGYMVCLLFAAEGYICDKARICLPMMSAIWQSAVSEAGPEDNDVVHIVSTTVAFSG